MIFEWDKLPRWIEQEIETAQERLCTDIGVEDTIKYRARIRLLREILLLPYQEPPDPVDEMTRLAIRIEEKEGYAD